MRSYYNDTNDNISEKTETNAASQNTPQKNYYKKLDGGDMFIDELPHGEQYTPGEIRSKENEIKELEEKEKAENNGKMISNFYVSDADIDKTERNVKAIATFYLFGFIASMILGMVSRYSGIFLGLLLISLSILLFFIKQREGYNQNASKALGVAVGIPGALMVILNIIFNDDTATPYMVLLTFAAVVAAGYVQNTENTMYMNENAKDLIQAVCVDIEKKYVSDDEGTRHLECYPVFEIEYKGMHKRLKARFKYTNPPAIGTKRIIHINPDNLDEWYDPQSMNMM